jgi:putative transposase
MTTYPTNLSNSQWQIISKFLDTQRNRKYNLRDIVNAILYVVKTGCQWRMLPGDFPSWRIVYYYFSKWNKQGVIEEIQLSLVEQVRKKSGKKATPTAGIIDAQSVKNTLVSSESKGFDAGKKIKGIKRHIIVDTLGLILAVVIQSASVQDRNGAMDVIKKLRAQFKKVILLFADGGYSGKLEAAVKQRWKIIIQIVKKPQGSAFKVLPKRWIVERTFSWIDTNRRNSKNYERLNQTCVAMVHLSAIRLMLNRI